MAPRRERRWHYQDPRPRRERRCRKRQSLPRDPLDCNLETIFDVGSDHRQENGQTHVMTPDGARERKQVPDDEPPPPCRTA